MAYAEKTQVPIDRSQGEIRKLLARHGATSFAFGETRNAAQLMFEMQGRRIVFNLPMPSPPSANANGTSIKTYDQLCRTKWRALVLAIKAKLECVENGITSLEQEFLAHIVLPNGGTVGAVMIPQIEQAYKTGKMPLLLGISQ